MFNKLWCCVFRVVKNGLFEFINEIFVGVFFFVINILFVINFGSIGVVVYSVVNYFIFLSIMFSFGIVDVFYLFVSYNCGVSYMLCVNVFLFIVLIIVFIVGLILMVCLLWFNYVFVVFFIEFF